MIAATSSSRSLQTKLSQMYTMHFQKSLNVVNNTQEVACTELKGTEKIHTRSEGHFTLNQEVMPEIASVTVLAMTPIKQGSQ